MSKETSNLTLKIVALIIAVVLWGYVMSDVNPEQSKVIQNISVSFNNLEALERKGLILMEPKDITVSVTVVGKKFDLADFSPQTIKAQVDLSGYSEGQTRVSINAFLEEFSNVKIKSVEPSDILFTFDRFVTIDKPVTISTQGSLGSDYVVGDITTKSEFVQLKGPRTWINEVDKIVAVVDIDGRTQDANVAVPIKLVDDQGKEVLGVTATPSVIDVNVPIYRTVTVPIELQTEVPENYEIANIYIRPSRIALKGDKNIANLISVQTKPIDMALLMDGGEVEVELDLPSNVSLLNPNEKVTVSLDVQEAFTKTFEYSMDEVQLVGLSEGLTLDNGGFQDNIEVQVKGKKDDIDVLTKDDVEVYLDLSIYNEGSHIVYIGVNLPENLAIKYIRPQPIEVKITSR